MTRIREEEEVTLCQSCIVMRYSTSNDGVPLKSGLKIIENGIFETVYSCSKCSSTSTVFEILTLLILLY